VEELAEKADWNMLEVGMPWKIDFFTCGICACAHPAQARRSFGSLHAAGSVRRNGD